LQKSRSGWTSIPAGRQRSAILPALYVIQREFGYCPIDAQNELAAILEIEPAEVGAVVDFYHMLHTEPKGEYHVEVCTNVPVYVAWRRPVHARLRREAGHPPRRNHRRRPVQPGSHGMSRLVRHRADGLRHRAQNGSDSLLRGVGLQQGCGESARPGEEWQGVHTLERWTPAGDPKLTGKAAGPYRIGGMEERFLTARVGKQDSHTIDTYIADGGYETAKRVLTTMKPEEVVEQVKASGIRGRGGAGFPTGMKWGFLAPAMPRYLVVNADESEPGTFKDRMIMEYDPHQLIEGIIISAFAIKAEIAFIYIRGEYYFGYTRLVEAVKEAKKGLPWQKDFRHRSQPAQSLSIEAQAHMSVAKRRHCSVEPGRLSRASAHEAALPGRRRALCQANHRQQCRIDLQCTAHHQAWCRLV
jgi:NADH-quinone oxidoreductase subunit F